MSANEKGKLSASKEAEKEKKSSREKSQLSEIKFLIRSRIRLIPIWLRIVLLLFFMMLSTIFGILIGYGVIGDGDMIDALKSSTWQHIIDLVEKESEE
ncbi:DNA-directed RNA polymerase subunit beta [Metabacillus fastidiosus]|uniref:DNA-directed RNA polymerase subunit beta n=1 Tax=Metabacillus fastidiosus TaxID=1458 RepID=UPI0009ED4657|nr:DNA-directed RNA polymerase subunit beta [Metabacillus fastidiosus]MED4464449.1 DNA-directed RNA polymerase subunit beta [Metabacillus fastidiosus]